MTQTDPLELLELAGIGLALAIAGLSISRARSAGREEADRQLAWQRNAANVQIAGIRAEGRVFRHCLNEHGLMDGTRIVPARVDSPTLYRPDEGEVSQA